jgi:hypothetical protein
MHSPTPRLRKYLCDRYPVSGIRYPVSSPQRIAVRDQVERICLRFIEAELADRDFENQLCSGSDSRFWQRLTEASLACDLLDARLRVVPSRDGPDLRIEHEGQTIWVECICPEPAGIPSEWLTHEPGRVHDFPHVPMLLRWTAAIKEKAEKLLGGPRGAGYLAKGVVDPSDSYVIAVNGRMLRGVLANLNGISQFPFAVEAAFAVGPMQVHIDRATLKRVSTDYQHRPFIATPKGAVVAAYTFLDERFAPISAIWAADFDDCSVISNEKALAVVHNPLALNPIPVHLLPVWSEYMTTELDGNELRLDRRPGSLADAGPRTADPQHRIAANAYFWTGSRQALCFDRFAIVMVIVFGDFDPIDELDPTNQVSLHHVDDRHAENLVGENDVSLNPPRPPRHKTGNVRHISAIGPRPRRAISKSLRQPREFGRLRLGRSDQHPRLEAVAQVLV